MTLVVDVGVFAHNEAAGIAAMVQALAAQDLLTAPGLDVRILVLANGCSDDTVARARAAILAAAVPGITVADLAQGGKSRTWTRFVHGLSRPGADILVFADADIRFPTPDSLRRLVGGLAQRPGLWALNSQPVKDIVADPTNLTRTDRLIAAAGGALNDWKTAICGQLYAMPAARARAFHLPVGLPVEDGFLRAMILTDALTAPEDFSRIDGLDGLFHIYRSERRISDLLRHQTRLVIGSAINTACFEDLRSLPSDHRHKALADSGEDWLAQVIRRRLPRRTSGYVPVHFAIKRVQRALANPRSLLNPKRLVVTVAGFGFDLIVYLRAQLAMARGTGAGHW